MRNETELDIDGELVEEALWKVEDDRVDELNGHELIGAIGMVTHEAALDMNGGNLAGAASRLEDVSVVCEHWCTIQEQSK